MIEICNECTEIARLCGLFPETSPSLWTVGTREEILAVIKKAPKKMTQQQIAGLACASQSLISAMVTGRRRPSWRMAKRLIQAVPGTTVELWMEGSPEEIRAAIKNAQQPNPQNEVAA